MKIIQQPILIQTTSEELESLCHTLYTGGSRTIADLYDMEKRMERYQMEMSDRDRTEQGVRKFIEIMEDRIISHKVYIGMVAKQLKKLNEEKFDKLMKSLSERGFDELRENIESVKIID